MLNFHGFLVVAAIFGSLALTAAADSGAARAELRDALGAGVLEAPAVHPAPEFDEGPIRGIFYDALPYEGKPTRVFAYLAVPEAAAGEKVPGMVLVHGGGGTAYLEWVRVWYDRGYAAIAMDLEGNLPRGNHPDRPRHEFSGPLRTGMFDDMDKPRGDQWMFHAVADVFLAHSLLRELPEVDANRVGLTGISWGGVVSSLVAGVDDRFVFAAPVYGCGYLYDSKGYFNRMGAKDDASLELRKFWDPARYFTDAPMPMLWVNGDNDPHFSVDVLSRGHASAGPGSILSIHPRMPHGHGPGWDPALIPEMYVLADHLLKGTGAPLARITAQPANASDGQVVMGYESVQPIVKADLYSLAGALVYAESEAKKYLDLVTPFERSDAEVDTTANTVTATLPAGCQWYYINLVDDRGCIVSSNLMAAGG
jgi:dienelactone hydrolase